MNEINGEAIDNFLDYLSRKPVKGSKSYNKRPDEIPCLSSSSIKKSYDILTTGFPYSKEWGYIDEIPFSTAPREKTKKRKAWDSAETAYGVMEQMNDALLHIIFHIGYVFSARVGEIVGIDIAGIDFYNMSVRISQEVQRVSDVSLENLPKQEIVRVFPKKISTSKSSLIIKAPKNERSIRNSYMTMPFAQEIKERLEYIEECKHIFGSEYQDYGLLICNPDGSPIDPKSCCKKLKAHQSAMGIPKEDQIDFQGVRKSGQMRKIRITNNNYQLVAANGGHTPDVLMSNYDEDLEREKRMLSQKVEISFYPRVAPSSSNDDLNPQALLDAVQNNPELSKQIMALLMSGSGR